MKKLRLLSVLVVLFLISSTAFCKDIEVRKQGGVRKILTFWKLTFSYVYYFSNDTGKTVLECCGEGGETCKKPSLYGSNGSIVIDKNEYYEKVIDGVFNEIIDLVDQSIFDGNETGNVSKKISTKTIDGKEMILAFTAVWNNADVKTGDVNYIIKINEIEL